MPGKKWRLIVLLSLYLLAITGGAAWLVVRGAQKYQATATPSLTPLSLAQHQAQMQAVHYYDNGDYAAALPIFTQLAALGDARAETDLGEMYYNGWGVTQDVDRAYALQLQAVAQNYGKAEDNLGWMYDNRGDEISATHWFWRAAGHGNADGQADLGRQLHLGYSVARDDTAAIHWFRLSAAQGNLKGEFWMGAANADGAGVPQDYALAMHWYQAAAAQGETASMCQIGVLYEYGDGVTRDYGAAMQWYRRAADDDADCGYIGVGFMDDLGLGVPPDEMAALQWYKAAADDGDVTGENNLGAMYHRGAGGVKQDFAAAAHWFGLAADQGSAMAEMNLATLYINGQGVPHSDVRGFILDQRAAAQDEPHAEEQLGNAYRLGYATKIDFGQAAEYYTLAAGQGLPKAQQALAYLYETGQGVPHDDEQALRWYLISQTVTAHPIIEDDERCQEFAALPVLDLVDIKAHLTQPQMAQAQAEAASWLAAHRPLHDPVPPPSRPIWVIYAIGVILLALLATRIQHRFVTKSNKIK